MKKRIVFLVIIAILLVVNLVPLGKVADSSTYYKDMEYLGMYNIGNTLMGNNGGGNMPLNTNHLLLKTVGLVNINGVFSTLMLTLIYLVVFGLSLYTLLKATKNYKWLVLCLMAFVLGTKNYLAYTVTALPFGGIYTFFLSAVMLLSAMFVRGKATVKSIIAVSLVTIALGCYDTVTALIGAVFAVMIIFLSNVSQTKKEKITAIVSGALVFLICIVFFASYQGVNYQENINSAIENGISMYDQGANPQSNFGIIKFYVTNLSHTVDFLQKIMNNAFYQGENAPFSLSGFIKAKFLPVDIWMFAGLLVLLIVISAVFWKKNKNYGGVAAMLIALCVMAGIALKISGFLVGISNLNVNLLLFNLVFDTIVVVLVPSIAYVMIERRNNLKEKYGVTQ